MQNKNYMVFKYFIIILIFIIPFFSCAIYDLAQALNTEGNLDPSWDLEFDIDILKKNISIDDYIKDISIDTFDAEAPNIAQWPILAGVDNEYPVLTEDIDISTMNKYDFDNNGSDDFLVKGVRSTTAAFTLRIWLTLTGDPTILPFFRTSDIELNNLTIEGIDYTFYPPELQADGSIIYIPNNFLNPAYDYYLNFGNDPMNNIDQLNVSSVNVRLIPATGPLDYPNIPFPGYSLHAQAVFDLGDDFGVVGEITNPVPIEGLDELLNVTLIDENSSYEGINDLIFNYDFENNTPFIVTIQQILTSTTLTPVPDTYITQIEPGNIVQHSNYAGYNNYWYVTSTGKSSGKIKLVNISQYNDVSMDVLLNLETYADNRNILFTPRRSSISVKMNIEGEATVGL